jgi:hypothetical protein
MGRLMVVKRGTVPGPPGAKGDPGDPGPGGGANIAVDKFFTPMSYGAAGDGETDDQSALEDCFEAAAAAGGIVIIDRPYGFSGKIKHYGGMEVWQIRPRRMLFVDPLLHLHPWELPIEPGLIAVGAGAWYQYGDGSDGSGSANDNPGPIKGLAIDGRGIAGGGDGLFVMDAAQSSIYDLMVVYSAGHGLRTGRSQNINLINPQIGGCAGTGFKIKTLDGLDTQQGAGHIITFGGHIHDNYVGVEIDMGAGTFFPPHDNVFNTTLIESGRNADLGPVKCAVDAKAGQTQFNDVNITFGTNATAHEQECCILIDNPTTTGFGSVSTIIGYRGGSIGGGPDSMVDGIRIKQTSAANELRLEGRIAWANLDYQVCMDGINGGFCDPIFSHTGQDVLITGGIKKMRALDGGTFLNGYRKSWVGQMYELPTGERSDSATLANGDVPNVFVVKHADESVARFSIDWNATGRYVKTVAATVGSPAPIGSTIGTTLVNGDIHGVTGRWGIGGAYYRLLNTGAIKSLSVNTTALNLEWDLYSYILLAFSAGADLSGITLTPQVTLAGGAPADAVPTRGQELRLGISAVSTGSVITWPANFVFDGTAPQPISGVLQFVDFVYDIGSSKWFELNRSHQIATAVAGSDVTFTPSGGLSSTTVQDALVELDTEKAKASVPLTTANAIGTAAKTAVGGGYAPASGDVVVLTLTNGNSAASPTLNIGGGGAKNILLGGSAPSAAAVTTAAGGIWTLRYDGTSWHLTGAQGLQDLSTYATLASPTFTGTVTVPTPTAADNSTKAASTAFVQGELTAKAPVASPTFTGDPKAPTPTTGDNDTSIATTAFVQGEIAGKAKAATTLTTANAIGVAAKTAAGSAPASGDVAVLTLTNGNSAASPTLNIGGTGAKNILLGGSAPSAAAVTTAAGGIWTLRYDGTSWHLTGAQGLQDLSTYALLASPTFTGTVTIPTPAANDSTTKAASTAYVQTELTDYASDTVTLTNKRVTKRVDTTTSTATYTFNWDSFDAAKITGQAAALVIANPTGTPTSMQGFILRVKDNGTARAITYGTQFRAIGVTLPTTTVIGKYTYYGCIWNSEDTKVDVIAVAQEA